VTLGIFCLMTSELLPVGLLTPVSEELAVSDGTAGLMVTMPGLVAALFAPLIAVYGARLDRRLLLCVLIALVGAANLACALAPEFTVVLVARLLVGFGIGGFWATAGGLAGRLVPPARIGRATTVIFGGVSAAAVLGVPAGTLLCQVAGWRAAFAGIGVLALLAGVCTALALPNIRGTRTATLTDLTRVLRGNAGVKMGLLVTILLVTGQFTAYTFVRPVLQDVSGVDDGLIGPVLLAYGAAGVAGSFLLGGRASRHLHRTLIVVAWKSCTPPPTAWATRPACTEPATSSPAPTPSPTGPTAASRSPPATPNRPQHCRCLTPRDTHSFWSSGWAAATAHRRSSSAPSPWT
jgi:predicted MFS family arabinose efflux permease